MLIDPLSLYPSSSLCSPVIFFTSLALFLTLLPLSQPSPSYPHFFSFLPASSIMSFTAEYGFIKPEDRSEQIYFRIEDFRDNDLAQIRMVRYLFCHDKSNLSIIECVAFSGYFGKDMIYYCRGL